MIQPRSRYYSSCSPRYKRNHFNTTFVSVLILSGLLIHPRIRRQSSRTCDTELPCDLFGQAHGFLVPRDDWGIPRCLPSFSIIFPTVVAVFSIHRNRHLHTIFPLGNTRNSGSPPQLPIRVTEFAKVASHSTVAGGAVLCSDALLLFAARTTRTFSPRLVRQSFSSFGTAPTTTKTTTTTFHQRDIRVDRFCITAPLPLRIIIIRFCIVDDDDDVPNDDVNDDDDDPPNLLLKTKVFFRRRVIAQHKA